MVLFALVFISQDSLSPFLQSLSHLSWRARTNSLLDWYLVDHHELKVSVSVLIVSGVHNTWFSVESSLGRIHPPWTVIAVDFRDVT